MLTLCSFAGKHSNMKIFPIRAFTDNYIWAIHHEQSHRIIVVDPGDAKPVIEYIALNDLELDGIIITHYHNDHIGGVKELKEKFHCPVYASALDQLNFSDHDLKDQACISFWDNQLKFKVIHVPGHTLGHVAYYEESKGLLFCGDTLFRSGCGRMFEGEPAQFLQSLQKLAELPKETKVFCTHEYTLSNLAFAEFIEPDNTDVQNLKAYCESLRAKDDVTLPSSIDSELKTNPFLRCKLTAVRERINTLCDRNDKNDHQIFASMRRLKDNF